MDPWHGGLVRRSELLEAGVSRRELERHLASGALRRARGGWYVPPDLDADRYLAARAGGRLTCITACRLRGMWIPPGADERPHLAVRSRLAPSAPAAVVHFRRDESLPSSADRLVVDPVTALGTLARCQASAVTFVVAESALERRLITADEWRRMLERLPAGLRLALLPAADLSGSGTESEFKRQLRRLGIRFQQQVQIGPDRVDFVLKDGTVVEIDSRRHHDPLKDARRDARLSVAGHDSQRFFYDQVWFEWPMVERALLAGIARRAARSAARVGLEVRMRAAR